MLKENESDMKEQDDVVVASREHPVAKAVGWLVTAACCVGLGWLGRGLMPAPKAGGDAAAMMAHAGLSAPQVVVTPAVASVLNPPIEYIGHVEAIRDVDLRAQIEGYVKAIHFVEGALVHTGDLLFTIDPEQYEAKLALRRAELAQAKAALDRDEKFLKRLESSDARGITQSDLDTARSAVAQGGAGVQQAEANLRLAEIDLKHTRIVAPIDGQIGRTVANVGDYVSPSLGTLVRIVQMDPVRVVFSLTDRDYVKVRENVEDGDIRDAFRIRLRLPTGTVPEMTGARDFENNEMSQDTATLPVRVRFDNAKGFLVPGGFVTVLIDQTNPATYPAIPQSALTVDKDGTYVYVVDAAGKVEQRRVTTGTALGGQVEVRDGLKTGERVIVQGVQKVRPGLTVQAVEQSGDVRGQAAQAPAKEASEKAAEGAEK